MSKRKATNRRRPAGRDYRISVRAVRHEKPDIPKLARAVIELAMAQAEADAQKSDTTTANNASDKKAPDSTERA